MAAAGAGALAGAGFAGAGARAGGAGGLVEAALGALGAAGWLPGLGKAAGTGAEAGWGGLLWGKGDARTLRGKRFRGTFGKARPTKKRVRAERERLPPRLPPPPPFPVLVFPPSSAA